MIIDGVTYKVVIKYIIIVINSDVIVLSHNS